jgi:hypothetical protein
LQVFNFKMTIKCDPKLTADQQSPDFQLKKKHKLKKILGQNFSYWPSHI